MDKFIAVIDYGLGNLRSVAKALEAVGAQVKVTAGAKDIDSAAAIVLPGVGAFKSAMENLERLDILPALLKVVKQGRPFLGICLGLQVLFSESEEHGRHKGLGLLEGKVKKFPAGVKIPHMGWNSVEVTSHKSQVTSINAQLFRDVPQGSYFYFVHSYYVQPQDKTLIAATTVYGREFTSAIHKDNIWGLQFHPEKSAELGLKILENFYRDVD